MQDLLTPCSCASYSDHGTVWGEAGLERVEQGSTSVDYILPRLHRVLAKGMLSEWLVSHSYLVSL